jgi:hypothetical protein
LLESQLIEKKLKAAQQSGPQVDSKLVTFDRLRSTTAQSHEYQYEILGKLEQPLVDDLWWWLDKTDNHYETILLGQGQGRTPERSVVGIMEGGKQN